MASRYSKYKHIQPTRLIKVSPNDIIRVFKNYDNLDTWAQEYYGDSTMSWVIMCANPIYNMEFQIPTGATIRIPMPIDRVWQEWGENAEI